MRYIDDQEGSMVVFDFEGWRGYSAIPFWVFVGFVSILMGRSWIFEL